MRRSSGEGSVYKRKDGLWVAQYELGGKRRYLYGKTKKAVTDRLREAMSSRAAILAPEAEKMLLGEFLDRWLPGVEGTVRRRTFGRHEEVVRLHLKPSIGGIGIKDRGPWRSKSFIGRSCAQDCRLARCRSSTPPSTRL